MKLPEGVSYHPENRAQHFSIDQASPCLIQLDPPSYTIQEFTYRSQFSDAKPIVIELPENWAWFDRLFRLVVPRVVSSVAVDDIHWRPTITVVRNLETEFGPGDTPLRVLGWACRKCHAETIFEFQSFGFLFLDEPVNTLYMGSDGDKVVIPGEATIFLFNLAGDDNPLITLDVSPQSTSTRPYDTVPSLLAYIDREVIVFDRNGKQVITQVEQKGDKGDLSGRLFRTLTTDYTVHQIADDLGITVLRATRHVSLATAPGLHIIGWLADAVAPGSLVSDEFLHGRESLQGLNLSLSKGTVCERLNQKRNGGFYDTLHLEPAGDHPLSFYVPFSGAWFDTIWPQNQTSFVQYLKCNPQCRPNELPAVDGMIVSLPDCENFTSAIEMMKEWMESVALFIVDQPLWLLADWHRLGNAYFQHSGYSSILLLDYYRYSLLQDSYGLCDLIMNGPGSEVEGLTLAVAAPDLKQALFHLLAVVDLFWEINHVDSILLSSDRLTMSTMDSRQSPILCSVVLRRDDGGSLQLLGSHRSPIYSIAFPDNDNSYRNLLEGLRQAIPDRFIGLLTPIETDSILEILDSLPGGLM